MKSPIDSVNVLLNSLLSFSENSVSSDAKLIVAEAQARLAGLVFEICFSSSINDKDLGNEKEILPRHEYAIKRQLADLVFSNAYIETKHEVGYYARKIRNYRVFIIKEPQQ